MLNELIQLADSLEKADISPKDWHPLLKPLPNISNRKPCYRISIAENGTVTSIDTLNAEQVAVLRKYEPNLGSSFPGFNIQPLYRITDNGQNKQIKAWREGKEVVDVQFLKRWCIDENENWDTKIRVKLYKCLSEVPQKLSEHIDSQTHCMAIKRLVERVIRYPHEGVSVADSYEQGFREAIEKHLWASIETGESLNILLPFLVLEGNADKMPDRDRGAVSVFLDIPDWQEYRVSSRESIEALNDCLVSIWQPEKGSESLDAFGVSLAGSDDKLPSIKMPIIADVKLRAMTRESPCQLRYRSIDAASFPVGQESRKRAKGALEWLGDPAREGETWGRADAKELIFAYPNVLPRVPLRLAACFGSHKSDDADARFANAARDVIQGLNGMAIDLKTLELRVFALKKMDKARTKVVFHRNYTAQRLIDAAKEWQNGCHNVPHIKIYGWGAIKGSVQTVDTGIPFPLDISRCLNAVWKFEGQKKRLYCEAIDVFHAACGIELLLEQQVHAHAVHLLSSLLSHARQLLLFLADAGVRKRVLVLTPNNYDIHKLYVPSMLGLLLYKLGIKKEEYMKNASYLVGRMMKLADELHALYCREVRDNKLPPQLIGNSLMTAALDNPAQALAQLALRLKPYYGWAQTFGGNERGNLAGYFVKLYGEVALQLAQLELPARFNDSERAQVLLGYLASNPKQDETSMAETIHSKGD